MTKRRATLAAALVAVALLVARAAAVVVPVRDLSTGVRDDAVLYGRAADDRAAVVAGGDLDGDGVDDLAIGYPGGDGPADARAAAGDVVVALGGTTTVGEVDLAAYAGDSVVLYGVEAGDGGAGNDGLRLAFGDLDGDGRDDLAIAFLDGDGPANGRADAGDVVVVFGGSLAGEIDLRAYAGESTVVYGRDALDATADRMGLAVGDFDGDGRDDLAIGYPGGDGPANGRDRAGDVVVVFGAASLPTAIDLRAYAGDSSILYGVGEFDFCGASLAAGDLDGDGIDDLAIGCGGGDGPADARTDGAGDVVVVFGGDSLAGEIDLRAYTGESTVIYGREALDAAGDASVREVGLAAGDLDADGRADLAIGLGGADGPANGRADAGEVLVVFGAASLPRRIDLAGYAGESAVLYPPTAGDAANEPIPLAIGDLDGDGPADLAIGLGGGDGPADVRLGAGDAVVVFGGGSLAGEIDLRTYAGDSAVVFGVALSDADADPLRVATLDLDGDGLGDLAGAWRGGDGPLDARSGAGDVHVVRGTFHAAAPGVSVQALLDPVETTAAVSVTPASTDSFVQVNLGGATVVSPASAANLEGAGASHRLSTRLLDARDTVAVSIWTSLGRAGALLALRSDTTTIDTTGLDDAGIRNDTGRRALAATAVLVEFLGPTGAVIGTTTTTSDVSSLYAYTLCYDLSETTTRLYKAVGIDTADGSADFGFWIADSYAGRWRSSGAPVRVVDGGDTVRVCVVGLSTDLPGALAGAAGGGVASVEGGGCLLERAAPRAWLDRLRAWRDRLLSSLLGRWLARRYYGG